MQFFVSSKSKKIGDCCKITSKNTVKYIACSSVFHTLLLLFHYFILRLFYNHSFNMFKLFATTALAALLSISGVSVRQQRIGFTLFDFGLNKFKVPNNILNFSIFIIVD